MNRTTVLSLYGLGLTGPLAAALTEGHPRGIAAALLVVPVATLTYGALDAFTRLREGAELDDALAKLVTATADDALTEAPVALRERLESALEGADVAPTGTVAAVVAAPLLGAGVLAAFVAGAGALTPAGFAIGAACALASGALVGIGRAVEADASRRTAAIARVARGPLRARSRDGRLETTLVALAERGESLPAAARSLATATERLEALGEMLPRHVTSAVAGVASTIEAPLAAIGAKLATTGQQVDQRLATTTRTLDERLGAVHSTLDTKLGTLGSALDTKLGALGSTLDTRLAKTTAAVEQHLGAATAAIDLRLGATATAVDSRLAATTAAIDTRLASTARTLDEGLGQTVRSLDGHLGSLAAQLGAQQHAALEQVGPDLAAHVAALAETLERESTAAREAERAYAAELAASLEAHADALATRAERSAEALTRAGEAQLEANAERVARAVREEAARHLEASRKDALAAVEGLRATQASEFREIKDAFGPGLAQATAPVLAEVARIGGDFGRVVASLEAERGALAERDAAVAERLGNTLATLETSSSRTLDAAREHLDALRSAVEAAEARVAREESASADRIDALLATMSATVDADRARTEQLSALLERVATDTASRVAADVVAHTREVAAELDATHKAVRAAAALVQAGGTELGSLATLFADSIDRHRDAAERWLENLGAVEAAVAEAGERAASKVLEQRLARTYEIFDRQLEFQSELLERLRSMRDSSVGTVAAVSEPDEAVEPLHAEAGE